MIVAKKQLSLGEQLDAKYTKIRDNREENKQLKAEILALHSQPVSPGRAILVDLERLHCKRARLRREQRETTTLIEEQHMALIMSGYEGEG